MSSVGDGMFRRPSVRPESHITGDQRDGGQDVGHHSLGFIDAVETALAQMLLLGSGAHRFDWIAFTEVLSDATQIRGVGC